MRNHLLGDGASKPAIPQTPDGGYWHKSDEKYRDVMSVDGAYMAYPFLLRYGLMANKKKSWTNKITGQSTQFWSRASGWYAMALVDMLEVLPKELRYIVNVDSSRVLLVSLA